MSASGDIHLIGNAAETRKTMDQGDSQAWGAVEGKDDSLDKSQLLQSQVVGRYK